MNFQLWNQQSYYGSFTSKIFLIHWYSIFPADPFAIHHCSEEFLALNSSLVNIDWREPFLEHRNWHFLVLFDIRHSIYLPPSISVLIFTRFQIKLFKMQEPVREILVSLVFITLWRLLLNFCLDRNVRNNLGLNQIVVNVVRLFIFFDLRRVVFLARLDNQKDFSISVVGCHLFDLQLWEASLPFL